MAAQHAAKRIELVASARRLYDAAEVADWRAATADLRTVWNAFQSTVEQHGWIDEDRFTDIVVQIVGATRLEDFVAKPE